MAFGMTTEATTVQITMPAMGESVTEGTVLEWLKQVGEQVEADEPLVEISTDKVDGELPAPATGTLTKILIDADSTVKVGDVLGEIETGDGASEREPPSEESGELVDVTFGRESGRRILRLTVDREGGVDLDTISQISRKVSRRLDLEGFEPGPYALEVTTPGIERSLRRPQDFRRAVGQRVRVKTGEGVLEGELRAAEEDAIRIAAQDDEHRVALDEVAAARTVVDWDAELKGSDR